METSPTLDARKHPGINSEMKIMPTDEDLNALSPTVVMKPAPRRMRVVFSDEVIADSTNARVMYETHHPPVYYFPVSDVRMDLLEPTNHGST